MSLELLLFAANSGIQSIGAQNANKITGYGTRLEQQEIDSQFKQLGIATTEANIASTQQLGSVLSYNAAYSAMRGQAGGVGSALAVQNKNVGDYYADLATRDLNMNIKRFDSKIQKEIVGLNGSSQKSARNSQAFTSILNSTSFNTLLNGKKSLATPAASKPAWGY